MQCELSPKGTGFSITDHKSLQNANEPFNKSQKTDWVFLASRIMSDVSDGFCDVLKNSGINTTQQPSKKFRPIQPFTRHTANMVRSCKIAIWYCVKFFNV